MDINSLADHLSQEWASITFEDLFQRAMDAPEGVSFSSLRLASRPRMFLAVCFADPDLMASLLTDPSMQHRLSTNWANLFIADAVTEAFRTGRVEGYVRLDSTGKKSALALIAATPDSVTKLEHLVTLPNG